MRVFYTNCIKAMALMLLAWMLTANYASAQGVVQIGTAEYASWNEAMNALTEKDTVELLSNVILDVVPSKACTIDGQDNTLTFNEPTFSALADIKFLNVNITTTSDKIICYANGHTFELAEKAKTLQPCRIYGGSERKSLEHSKIIIRSSDTEYLENRVMYVDGGGPGDFGVSNVEIELHADRNFGGIRIPSNATSVKVTVSETPSTGLYINQYSEGSTTKFTTLPANSELIITKNPIGAIIANGFKKVTIREDVTFNSSFDMNVHERSLPITINGDILNPNATPCSGTLRVLINDDFTKLAPLINKKVYIQSTTLTDGRLRFVKKEGLGQIGILGSDYRDDAFLVKNTNGDFKADVLSEPFSIETADDLRSFTKWVNRGTSFDGKTVNLQKDIDMKNEPWEATSISKPFKGDFNGNGHIISNLSTTDPIGGLFGYIYGATIRNLKLKDISYTGGGVTTGSAKYLGGLVGFVGGTSTITNCSVTGTLSGKADKVGGLIGAICTGESLGEVSNCFANINIDATVENSDAGVGGLAGCLDSQNESIKYSYATGKIKVSSANSVPVGGLVGSAAGYSYKKIEIVDTYAATSLDLTNLTDRTRVGAFIGYLRTTNKDNTNINITNAYWTDIDLKDQGVGKQDGSFLTSTNFKYLSPAEISGTDAGKNTAFDSSVWTYFTYGYLPHWDETQKVAALYPISYNLDGGTNPDGSATCFTIESADITLPIPTKAGYHFMGWYANQAYTDPSVTTISKGSFGDKTFYAKWKEGSSVSFGTPEKATMEVKDGENIIATGAYVKKESTVTLTFVPENGYCLAKNNPVVTGADQTSITITQKEGNPNVYTFTMPAQPITLSAQFEPDSLRLASITSGDSLLISQTDAGWFYQIKNKVTTKSLPLNTDIPFNGTLSGVLAGDKTLSFEPTCKGELTFDNVTVPSLVIQSGTSVVLSDASKLTYTEVKNEGGALVAREGATITNTVTGQVKMNKLTIATPQNGTLAVRVGDVAIASGDMLAVDTKFSVTATPASGYQTESLSVKTATADVVAASGLYTMPDAEVTVSATFKNTYVPPVPDPVYYTVTLPSVEGAVTSPQAGEYSREEGYNFSFSLMLEEGYKHSTPVVKANGVAIAPRESDGQYILRNIREDIHIGIEGIIKDTPTGNAEIDGIARLQAVAGILHIYLPKDETVLIYTASSILYKNAKLAAGDSRIELPCGIYFVKIAGKTYKVALR